MASSLRALTKKCIFRCWRLYLVRFFLSLLSLNCSYYYYDLQQNTLYIQNTIKCSMRHYAYGILCIGFKKSVENNIKYCLENKEVKNKIT